MESAGCERDTALASALLRNTVTRPVRPAATWRQSLTTAATSQQSNEKGKHKSKSV